MKKYIFTILFLTIHFISKAQFENDTTTLIRYIPIPTICDNNPCNYVSNGSFEQSDTAIHCALINATLGNNLTCWKCRSKTYDVYSNLNTFPTCALYPTLGAPSNTYPAQFFSPPVTPTYLWQSNPDSAINHNFIGLGGWYASTSSHYIESVESRLNYQLMPQQSYVLKLKAKLGNGTLNNFYDGVLRVMADHDSLTSTFTSSWNLNNFNTLTDIAHSLVLKNDTNVAHVPTYWMSFTVPFKYSGTLPANYLFLICDNQQTFLNCTKSPRPPLNAFMSSYIFVDDVSIEDSTTAITLQLPTFGAGCLFSIPDLSVYLHNAKNTNGTFYGKGVSYNNGIYSYNPIAAGAGSHIITYKYFIGGCPRTASDNIKGGSAVMVTLTNNTITDPCNIFNPIISATASGGSGNFTFTWSNSSNCTITSTTSTATSSSISCTYTSLPFTVNCTITDIVTGCSITYPNTVGNGNYIYITNSNNLSSSLPSSNLVKQKIVLAANTNWIINSNLTLDSCEVICDANSQISIQNGKTFDVKNNSYLHGCTYLWNGITISSMTSKLKFTSSRIEDAKVAINATNTGRFEINNSNLNKNVTHIQLQNSTYNSTPSAWGFVKASTFDCTTNLKSALPSTGITKTQYCINLINAGGFTVGDSSIANNTNTCRNAVAGIVAQNQMYLGVFNNTFNNINGGGATFKGAGAAVYSYAAKTTANDLVVGSKKSTGLSHNTFNYCDTAVASNFINVFANFNTMNYCSRGIHADYLMLRKAELIGNVLNYPNVGIRISFAAQNAAVNGVYGSYIKVEKNNIVQSGGNPINPVAGNSKPYIGIYHNDLTANTKYKIDISKNYLIKPDVGVQILSSTMDNVYDNHITLPKGTNTMGSFFTTYGIYSGGSNTNIGSGINISCNLIDRAVSNTYTKPLTNGVYLSMTKNTTVKNNIIKENNRGLVTENLSTTNIAYIRNEMYKCNYAIMRLNNSNPGNQPSATGVGFKPANIFTPQGWYNGTSHFTLGIASCTATTPNTMDLTQNGIYDAPVGTYYSSASNIAYQWQANYNNTNSNASASNCYYPSIPCPACSTSNAILNSQDFTYAQLIAKGDVEYTDFEQSSRWMDERDLYERIKQDTSLITNDSILYAFYQQKQSGFLGQLYEILYIYNRTAILKDSIDINVAKMTHDFIQNMPAENICEQNLKDVYEVYFRTIGSGNADFQENDSILLSSIAIQCPADGCEGVYYARSILSMFNHESFDDSTLCNNETYTFRKKNKQIVITNANIKRKINNEIKIVPNPTYQNFSININNLENGYYAEIFDITGKLQSTIPLTGKTTQVNCEQCSKGVLFIRVKSKDGIEIGKPQKVVLLKNE